jgi:hypothetical protein
MKLLSFTTDFSKNTQITDLMKILLAGAELLHTGGRTDMTKLIVAFRNFANARSQSVDDVQWNLGSRV